MRIAAHRPLRTGVIGLALLGLANALLLPGSAARRADAHAWLGKLNSFGGDFRAAEMVKAFITSTEYRTRFGQP